MAQTDVNDDVIKNQVNQMLDELIEVALRTAGGTVDGGVVAWWRNQYKAKFFYAIRVKQKTYAADRTTLLKKAEALGNVARSLAGVGPITTLHAAIASHQVDCPPIDTLEDWCN
jgi:hypothetical protein